jgi:hypothetical protein
MESGSETERALVAGEISLASLQGLCIPDHVPKTERGRKARKLKRRERGP